MTRYILLSFFSLMAFYLTGQETVIEKFDLTGTLNFSYDYEFAEDSAGNVFLLHYYVGNGAVQSKLLRYAENQWSDQSFSPCETCIRDIEVSPEGQLFVAAGDEGVFKWDGSEWRSVVSDVAIRITFKTNGDLFIVNNDGVFSFDGTTVTPGNNALVPSFFIINDIQLDQDESLWLLMSSKVYKYTNSEGWIHRQETLSPLRLELSQDNKLWVTENHGGVSYFDGENYKYNQITGVFPSGLKSTAFTIDQEDNFLLGVQGDTPGIIKYDGENKKVISSMSMYESEDLVTEIFVDSEGDIWAASNYTNKIAFIDFREAQEPTDSDGDGFNSDVDCDDNNADVNPEGTEIANNDIDEDCDGELLIIDVDGDGFNSDVDCDDNNASINSGAEEIPNNDIDENCDGELLIIDVDGDGFNSDVDCDDNNADVNPDGTEIPNNDIDEDCNGELLIIDEDGDGFNSDVDCDDNNADINPDAEDLPNNGIDENCDGADLTSAVSDFALLQAQISPNPTKGKTIIHLEVPLKNGSLRLVNINGQVVTSMNNLKATQSIEINASHLPKGIYSAILVDEKNRIVLKLVIE